ncbi:MAG: GGDEF domain-containing protein [Anaerolineae bacterium]|nr:MAG: GGDEF domain-containing protein [Anaerolineae bacterium]
MISKPRIYIGLVVLFGAVFLGTYIFVDRAAILNQLGLLIFLCVLGSIGLIFNVYGLTEHSHFNISFLAYSFALFHLGVGEAGLVVLVSHLVEWPFGKYKFQVQAFNIGQYVLSLQASAVVLALFGQRLPLVEPISLRLTLAITLSLIVFVFTNHVLVGTVIRLTSGESFKESGILSGFPLMLDFTFLTLGLIAVMLWFVNPLLSFLALVPVYLMYSTLRVPALERASEVDQKTGLFNAAFFASAMQAEISRAKRFHHPISIVMADMDLLRNINNSYGHLAGDQVLIEVSGILKKNFREYDVVARFGGEEFSIMMPETDAAAAHERIENVRKQIEEHEIVLKNYPEPIHVSLSFGVASKHGDELVAMDIIHHADIALYLAKLSGRNRTILHGSEEYDSLVKEFALSDSFPKPASIEERIGKPIADRGTKARHRN